MHVGVCMWCVHVCMCVCMCAHVLLCVHVGVVCVYDKQRVNCCVH